MFSLTQTSCFFPGHTGSEAAELARCASEVFGDKIWDMQVPDGCGLGPWLWWGGFLARWFDAQQITKITLPGISTLSQLSRWRLYIFKVGSFHSLSLALFNFPIGLDIVLYCDVLTHTKSGRGISARLYGLFCMPWPFHRVLPYGQVWECLHNPARNLKCLYLFSPFFNMAESQCNVRSNALMMIPEKKKLHFLPQ